MYLSFHNYSWSDKSDSSSTTNSTEMEAVDDSRSNTDSGVSPAAENSTENNNRLNSENASSAFTMDDNNLQPNDNGSALIQDKSNINDSLQQDGSRKIHSQGDSDGNHEAFNKSESSVNNVESDVIESTIPPEVSEADSLQQGNSESTRSQGDNDGNHDSFNESEVSVEKVELDVLESTDPREVTEIDHDQQDDHVDSVELEEPNAINFKSDDANEESKGDSIFTSDSVNYYL